MPRSCSSKPANDRGALGHDMSLERGRQIGARQGVRRTSQLRRSAGSGVRSTSPRVLKRIDETGHVRRITEDGFGELDLAARLTLSELGHHEVLLRAHAVAVLVEHPQQVSAQEPARAVQRNASASSRRVDVCRPLAPAHGAGHGPTRSDS